MLYYTKGVKQVFDISLTEFLKYTRFKIYRMFDMLDIINKNKDDIQTEVEEEIKELIDEQ